jgi:hypothetical protein
MLSIYVEGWQAQPRDGTVNVDAAGKTGKNESGTTGTDAVTVEDINAAVEQATAY